MRSISNKMKMVIVLFIIFLINKSLPALSQELYHSQFSSVLIAGTSTLHDWEMKSDKGHFEAAFILNADNKLTSIHALNFSVPSESLKSGHTMMDNNTYKALNTKAYNSISFVLSSVNITLVDATTYNLKCLGKLTIAGTTRETDLTVNCKWNAADKSFNCTGAKKIKMTDYNVKPPSVMMGTIKTGDEITITYNLKIIK